MIQDYNYSRRTYVNQWTSIQTVSHDNNLFFIIIYKRSQFDNDTRRSRTTHTDIQQMKIWSVYRQPGTCSCRCVFDILRAGLSQRVIKYVYLDPIVEFYHYERNAGEVNALTTNQLGICINFFLFIVRQLYVTHIVVSTVISYTPLTFHYF